MKSAILDCHSWVTKKRAVVYYHPVSILLGVYIWNPNRELWLRSFNLRISIWVDDLHTTENARPDGGILVPMRDHQTQ